MQSIEYFGHLISSNGISFCPERPNVKELKNIMGMVNYRGIYLTKCITVMNLLTDLLKSDVTWIWDHSQEEVSKKVIALLTETTAIAFFWCQKACCHTCKC